MTRHHARLNCFRGRLVAMTVAGSIAGYVPGCATESAPAPQVGKREQGLTDVERGLAEMLHVNVPLGADESCSPAPRVDLPQNLSALTARFQSDPNVDDFANSPERLSISAWLNGQVVITCEYFRTTPDPLDPYDGWSGGGGSGGPGAPPGPEGPGGPGDPGLDLDPPCAVAIPFQPQPGVAWAMLASYLAGPRMVACTPPQPAMPDCDTEEECSGSGGGGGGGPGDGPGFARHAGDLANLQDALIGIDFTDDEVIALATEHGRGDAALTARLLVTMREVVARNRELSKDPAYVRAAQARNQAMARRQAGGIDGAVSTPDVASAALPPGVGCVICTGSILAAISLLLITIGETKHFAHMKDPADKEAQWWVLVGLWIGIAGSLLLMFACYECPPFMAALGYVSALVQQLVGFTLMAAICIISAIMRAPLCH